MEKELQETSARWCREIFLDGLESDGIQSPGRLNELIVV
jgi:hypothetical protein